MTGIWASCCSLWKNWGQGKMADILQMTFSNAFSSMKKWLYLIKISLKFVPSDPIQNKPTLVQIMAWVEQGQAIIWINDDIDYWCLVYWCLYLSLGFHKFINDVKQFFRGKHERISVFHIKESIFQLLSLMLQPPGLEERRMKLVLLIYELS